MGISWRKIRLICVGLVLIVSVGVGLHRIGLFVDDRFNNDMAFDTDYSFQPANGRAVGRIFLFHGLRDNRSYWMKSPFDILTFSLRHIGYELVVLDLPYARRAYFDDGGARYCQLFKAQMQHVVDAVDAQHGPAARQLALGVSWGGYTL